MNDYTMKFINRVVLFLFLKIYYLSQHIVKRLHIIVVMIHLL
ncbi:hypothetical protein SXYLSMQ121_0927 [Staphylococcus xylosus]|nr:hypothetical protein SXYLSMQ121_0927 [Staphylococcus xylosus]